MTEIELEAGPQDAPVRVVLTSEGELLFPDGELEYDQAFMAMGGPETELIKLAKKWESAPIPTIIGDFGVPYFVQDMLLIDSAEHVLPIREGLVDPVQSKLARRIIKQCRIVLAKDESTEAKKKLRHLMHMLIRPPRNGAPGYNAEVCVHDAIWYAVQRVLGERVLFENFNPAADAAGYVAEPYGSSGADQSKNSPRFRQASRQEELWEIAHFVEIMNTLYDAVRDRSRQPHK
jgi:hypothetical protein